MQEAANTINTQRGTNRASYYLFITEKQILCQPTANGASAGILIAKLTGGEVNLGLSSKRWSSLATRIQELHEEGKI